MAHKSKSHKHHDKSKKKTAGSHRSSRRRSPSPQGSGAEEVQYDSDWYPELEQAISADIRECMELRNKLLNVVVAESVDGEEDEEEKPEEEQQQEEKKKEKKKSRKTKHKHRSREQMDDSTERKDGSTEGKDRSKEHKHRSKEHKHRSREHTDESTERKDDSPESKDCSKEHKHRSKKHKHRSKEHADHSTERKDRSKEHKDHSKKHKDHTKEHKDHSKEHKHRSKEHKHRSSEHLKHSTGRKDGSKTHKESEGVVVPLPRKFPPHIIKCDDGRVIVIDQKGEYGLGLDFTEGARIWAAQREQEKSSSTSVDRTASSTTTSNRGEEDAERRVTFDVESSAKSSDWYVSTLSATTTNSSDALGWSASDSSAKQSGVSSSDQSDGSWTAAMKAWPTTKPWFEGDEKKEEEVKVAQPSGFAWSFPPAGITIPPEIPHPVEELTRRYNRNKSSAGTMSPPKTHVPAEAQSSGSIWGIPSSTNIANPPKVPRLVKAAKYDWKDDWTSTSYSSCTPSVSTVTDSYGSSELSAQADSTWEISSTIASVDSDSEDDNDTIVPFSWRRKLSNESIYSEAGSTNPPEPSDAGSGLSWGDGNEQKNGHKTKASTWSTTLSEDQAQYGEGGWDSQSSWGGNIKRKDGYKSKTQRQSSTTPIRQKAKGDEESSSQYSWGEEVKEKPRSRISSFSNYKAPYVEDGSDSTEKKGKPKADDQKPSNGPKDKKRSRKYNGWSEEYSTPTSWRDV